MAGTNLCCLVQNLKPTILMVLVQLVFGGVSIMYKLAVLDGMSTNVLVAYRFIFASVFMGPLALTIERKTRPKLTKKVVFVSFLCGLFGGVLSQILGVLCLVLTSATFATALSNLTPAMIFISTVCLGMEKLALKTCACKAKLFGTALGIGGAMILTFYKGPQINLFSTNINLMEHHSSHLGPEPGPPRSLGHHLLGAFLGVGGCLAYAIWLLLQAKISEQYPCPYSITAMSSIFASIQASIIAMFIERKDLSVWKLGWNIRLLTAAYTGILASGLMYTIVAWCVWMSGPLFVSVFTPLALVFVALVGSIVIDEKLHLGSIIGSVVIIIGLYSVLWGKGQEKKAMEKLEPSKSSRDTGVLEIVSSSPNLSSE